MQNGVKAEGDAAFKSAFSDAATPKSCVQEPSDEPPYHNDFTAQVLERHEQLVNKIKSRK